jgi:uncharacterized tellurite resistance protein B-like protein
VAPGLAGDALWVPAGQTVSVAGFSLSGGLIYIGRELPSVSNGAPDPALIDPGLPVDVRALDPSGARMGYWPSYSDIDPGCRATYLQWLANGRHQPDAYIGYVFLYFYGLERRLLVDAEHSAAAWHERDALIGEVRRLLSIYGRNYSFRGYAQGLLAVTASAGAERRYLSPPPPGRDDGILPFELQFGLGQLAADSRPLPVDWALAWLRSHPEVWLRTPATRCPAEFNEVFARRYRDRFGDGLRLQPGAQALDRTYQPASAAIPPQHGRGRPAVPDVSGLGPPLELLRGIADEACTDLDAYSRYIGRHPDGAGTAAALALLPPGLERPGDAATQALLAWVRGSLSASDFAEATTAEFLARWPAAAPGSRPARADALALAGFLDLHGLGMEPDVRFGGRVPSGQARVVLFRRAATVVSEPSDGYPAAVTLMQLGAAVASADGQVAALEQDLLERRVAAAFSLAEDERRRLRAHLMRVIADPPTLASLHKRAAQLAPDQREEAGDLLVAVAGADGNIDPAETRLLNRMFDTLGLDKAGVPGPVRDSGGDPLTRVRMAGRPASGYALPPPASPEPAVRPGAVVLDPRLVAVRLAESDRAASYLAEIFTDDEPETTAAARLPPVTAGDSGSAANNAGLDAPHSALLRQLAGQLSWDRGDLDRVAASLGLMPGAALEILNDAALDAVGEPVCEGTDPVEINSYALEEMLR